MERTESSIPYALASCQIPTPYEVIRQVWDMVKSRRPNLERVLDLGAGDGRFACCANGIDYIGIEIDNKVQRKKELPRGCRIIRDCAFSHKTSNYDVCIGNPPYIRHHEIDASWRDRIASQLEYELGVRLDKKNNLFAYFICQGLARIKSDGLLAMVIPFEWVTRPSTKKLREFIESKGWSVDVYRYDNEIFPSVLTTACITLIDKKTTRSKWSYFRIDSRPTNSSKVRTRSISKDIGQVLPYSKRGNIWAMRGMSPGSQKIFCLSEGERIHHGLTIDDVVPCVSTMRSVPKNIDALTAAAFRKYFIDTGEKCWLLKSYDYKVSRRVDEYLKSFPKAAYDNFTCRNREIWYQFRLHPIPKLLVSSGFVSYGPKILRNTMKAYAVGTIFGIHFSGNRSLRDIQRELLSIDFEKQVVAHASTLRKIEVGQLNTALQQLKAS